MEHQLFQSAPILSMHLITVACWPGGGQGGKYPCEWYLRGAKDVHMDMDIYTQNHFPLLIVK